MTMNTAEMEARKNELRKLVEAVCQAQEAMLTALYDDSRPDAFNEAIDAFAAAKHDLALATRAEDVKVLREVLESMFFDADVSPDLMYVVGFTALTDLTIDFSEMLELYANLAYIANLAYHMGRATTPQEVAEDDKD